MMMIASEDVGDEDEDDDGYEMVINMMLVMMGYDTQEVVSGAKEPLKKEER